MFTSLYVYLQTSLQQLRREDRGASMVEYGLLVALIAVVVGGAAAILGGQIAGLFGDVGDMLP